MILSGALLPATVEMQGKVLYSAILLFCGCLHAFDELVDYPFKPDIQLGLVIRGSSK